MKIIMQEVAVQGRSIINIFLSLPRPGIYFVGILEELKKIK